MYDTYVHIHTYIHIILLGCQTTTRLDQLTRERTCLRKKKIKQQPGPAGRPESDQDREGRSQ